MTDDRPIGEMLPEIERHVELGRTVFLKWSCPACGERAIANDPNRYCTQGYLHEEKKDGSPCGFLYRGDLFGYLLVEQVIPIPHRRRSDSGRLT